MVPQSIINIPEICHQLGVQWAILSPGSRSAPISLAFTRHPHIQTEVIDDERSAGFVGLGRALQTRTPVVLVCTSGTAGLNYSPAVAEAYFQEVPLVVLTADRPPEWIDQWDGQTIRQTNLFGKHVKKAFSFPLEFTNEDVQKHGDRMIAEAVEASKSGKQGPVHINIPIREPFYPQQNQAFTFDKVREIPRVMNSRPQVEAGTLHELKEKLKKYHRRTLVVVGQGTWSQSLRTALDNFSRTHHIPVATDIISNAQGLKNAVHHQDTWLGVVPPEWKDKLRPDLLITVGKSVISKQLKLYLRGHRPQEHWHIQDHLAITPDPFQSLTAVIPNCPTSFFNEMATVKTDSAHSLEYNYHWQETDAAAKSALGSFFIHQPFSEFEAVSKLLNSIPSPVDLHLANSMAVRYANFIGLSEKSAESQVFANRGTSGIDGTTSTFRGAFRSVLSYLLTGDMAFFYDRNAFWGNKPNPLQRIMVLNNHGGGIFRMIPGPRKVPELTYLFDTHQPLTAQSMAAEWEMEYHPIHTSEELLAALPRFVDEQAPSQLVEVFTDKATNTQVFEDFKNTMRQTYGA